MGQSIYFCSKENSIYEATKISYFKDSDKE